jgi:predicted RNase H-like HicB family nuclease
MEHLSSQYQYHYHYHCHQMFLTSANESHSYLVVVEYCDVATGRLYGAFVPDVPGCTATGTSVEQALTHIQASLLSLVHTLITQGSMVPVAHSLEEHTAEYASEGSSLLTERSILAMVDIPFAIRHYSVQVA